MEVVNISIVSRGTSSTSPDGFQHESSEISVEEAELEVIEELKRDELAEEEPLSKLCDIIDELRPWDEIELLAKSEVEFMPLVMEDILDVPENPDEKGVGLCRH